MENIFSWTIANAILTAINVVAAIVSVGFVALKYHDYRKQKKWEQARSISAWIIWGDYSEEGDLKVHLSNNSHEPIYDVAVSIGVAYGAGPEFVTGRENNVCFVSVEPGEKEFYVPFGGGGMHMDFNPAVSFRDSNGLYWQRGARGVLFETKTRTWDLLEIDQPFIFDHV